MSNELLHKQYRTEHLKKCQGFFTSDAVRYVAPPYLRRSIRCERTFTFLADTADRFIRVSANVALS